MSADRTISIQNEKKNCQRLDAATLSMYLYLTGPESPELDRNTTTLRRLAVRLTLVAFEISTQGQNFDFAMKHLKENLKGQKIDSMKKDPGSDKDAKMIYEYCKERDLTDRNATLHKANLAGAAGTSVPHKSSGQGGNIV